MKMDGQQNISSLASYVVMYLLTMTVSFRELNRLLVLETATKAAEKGKWSKEKTVNTKTCHRLLLETVSP